MLLKINITGEASTKVALSDNSETTVGRGSSAGIKINSPSVSREHAKIKLSNGRLFVTDLGSINGTFINYEKLPPHQEVNWPDFFPLQLSANVSLEVVHEAEKESLLTNFSKNPRPTQVTDEITKTKREPIKSPPKNRPIKKTKQTGNTGKFKNIVIVIICILTGIYFFQNKETNESGNGTPEIKTKQEDATVLSPPPKDLADKVNSIQSKAACSEKFDKALCSFFKIKPNSDEAAYLVNKDLYVFLNFKERILNAEFDPSFSTATESEDRVKYLMFHLSFITLKKIVMRYNLDSVVVVNVQSNVNKNFLTCSKNSLMRLTDIDLTQIFGQLQSNQPKMFNQYLLPIVEYYSAP